MDFKERNPNLFYWPDSSLNGGRFAFPFNSFTRVLISEYDAPDFSTQFLALSGNAYEDAELNLHLTLYMIETPKNCKMRHAFKVGDISWEDFWFHRSWLIELQTDSLYEKGAKARYISPFHMDSEAKDTIREYNDQSPLQMKHDVLCRVASGWDPKSKLEAQKELNQLIANYGQHLVLKAA